MVAARFLVSGRVQGVFYRASTREQALALGLSGYAKNLPDGRVEVVASGAASAVDELERWLWRGPAAAKVTEVVRQSCSESLEDGFRTS
jgi:acylphosphatase